MDDKETVTAHAENDVDAAIAGSSSSAAEEQSQPVTVDPPLDYDDISVPEEEEEERDEAGSDTEADLPLPGDDGDEEKRHEHVERIDADNGSEGINQDSHPKDEGVSGRHSQEVNLGLGPHTPSLHCNDISILSAESEEDNNNSGDIQLPLPQSDSDGEFDHKPSKNVPLKEEGFMEDKDHQHAGEINTSAPSWPASHHGSRSASVASEDIEYLDENEADLLLPDSDDDQEHSIPPADANDELERSRSSRASRERLLRYSAEDVRSYNDFGPDSPLDNTTATGFGAYEPRIIKDIPGDNPVAVTGAGAPTPTNEPSASEPNDEAEIVEKENEWDSWDEDEGEETSGFKSQQPAKEGEEETDKDGEIGSLESDEDLHDLMVEHHRNAEAAFDQYDRQGRGCIKANELNDVLLDVGVELNRDELQSVLVAITDARKNVTRKRFLDWFFEREANLMRKEQAQRNRDRALAEKEKEDIGLLPAHTAEDHRRVEEAFDVFDRQGRGEIAANELNDLLQDLGVEFDRRELQSVIAAIAEGSRKKTITRKRFIDWFFEREEEQIDKSQKGGLLEKVKEDVDRAPQDNHGVNANNSEDQDSGETVKEADTDKKSLLRKGHGGEDEEERDESRGGNIDELRAQMEDDHRHAEEAWDVYDRFGRGMIRTEELVELLADLGVELDRDKLQAVIMSISDDRKTITRQKFLDWIIKYLYEEDGASEDDNDGHQDENNEGDPKLNVAGHEEGQDDNYSDLGEEVDDEDIEGAQEGYQGGDDDYFFPMPTNDFSSGRMISNPMANIRQARAEEATLRSAPSDSAPADSRGRDQLEEEDL